MSLLLGEEEEEEKKRGCKFMLQRERSTVETKMDGIKVRENVNSIYRRTEQIKNIFYWALMHYSTAVMFKSLLSRVM